MTGQQVTVSAGTAERAEPGLAITVLGQLSVQGVVGTALGDLDSRFHVKALFALLAASPVALERDALVAALWPRQPEAAGRNRLHHTAHLLKQSLAALSWPTDCLQSGAGRLALHERAWSDARCVAHAARCAEAGTLDDATLHAALRHCDAVWMPGLELGDAGERCRHQVRHEQALLLREAARRAAPTGDTMQRRELLARLLAQQPTDEWACQEVMALDLAAGRPNGALSRFEAVTRELAERLGLRPSADTTALAARARAQLVGEGSAPATPVPRGGALVGRGRECAELLLACRRAGAVVNLYGIGGVGKTALAAEVAHQLAAEFADAVFWLALADAAPPSSAAALCARTLGLPLAAAQPPLAAVLGLLRRQRLLLVLDDLDRAPAHAEMLAALQHAAHHEPLAASVLFLTCMPQPAPGVTVIELHGLALPDESADAAQAARFASVALLLLRCPVEPGGGVAGDLWLPDIARLVRRLDGLPLAIELAAARTAEMTPREILERVEVSLSVLSAPGSADGPAHTPTPRSMQAALQHSVDALPAEAAAVFPCLAVFTGGFTPADLAALLGELQQPPAGAGAALESMRSGGLVVADPDGRLRVRHLPRLLAQALVQADGRLPRLRQAWLAALHARLLALKPGYASPGFEDAIRAVAALHDDALAAIQQAPVSSRGLVVQMLLPLSACWLLQGRSELLQAWLQRALTWAQQLGMPREVLQLHLLLAAALTQQHAHAAALAHARAAEALARELQDLPATVHAVCQLADALDAQGQSDEARAQLHAVGVAFGLADPGAEGSATSWRWRLHPLNDGLRASLPRGEARQALRERHAGSAMWLALLAQLCRDGAASPDLSEAWAAADEWVQRAAHLDAAPLLAQALWARLWCELGLDRLDDCAASARRLRALGRETGDDARALRAALLSTELCWRRGELESAGLALTDAHQLSASLAIDPVAPDLVLHGAMLSALRGDADAAWPAWRAIALDAAGLAPPHLFMACEVAVVLHGIAGRAAAVGSIGAVLRQLDGYNEAAPLVQRFRARWFSALPLAAVPAARDQAHALLRGLLRGAAQASIS